MLRRIVPCLLLASVACDPATPAPDSKPTPTPQAAVEPTTPEPPAMKPATPPTEGAISVEEVATHPRPGTMAPGAVRFTPDGAHLTYLFSPEGSLNRDLYTQPVESGARKLLFTPPGGGATEDNLSEEEKLQRERLRMRSLGVTSYAWSKKADRFLVPVRGDLWVQEGLEGRLQRIVDTEGAPALDARFSPDGEFVAYVKDAEIYVAPALGGESVQVTRGARGTGKTHGLAEYIAQEEMGRHAGYWWSHDATRIAFTEVDERHIPVYRIEHQGKDAPHHEDHGYPFAGEANAKVRLGIVGREGGKPQWLDLGATGIHGDRPADDLYLARVNWMPDGSLMAQLENREQSTLHLVRYDAKGNATKVLEETSEVWINLHNGFRAFDEIPADAPHAALAGGFLWQSERTGFAHLYVYDEDGKEVRALTSGEWMVDSVAGVDQSKGEVYFTATKDGPTERHFYKVSMSGGDITKLTTEPGMHAVKLSPTYDRFIDQWDRLDTTPRIEVRNTTDGAVVSSVEIEVDPRVEELGLEPPELVTLTTRDGVQMHGAVYKPEGDGPFPTMVSVYGGPHAQRVQNDWSLTVDMRAQYLRSLGILVFKLDNRGAARRGLKFEGAIKHDMGNLEVQDQVDGVQWLVDQGLTQAEHVGIYGWSYGGYMSAMALARAPETFKVGIAGAPVSHWDGYDTHYTERYMGLPQDNAKGYEQSAVMAHVGEMTGQLMLVHGLIDENVHFRHTARLINALIAAQKRYELLLFPDERHMPRRKDDLVYMEQQLRDFVLAHL
ncbi:MAG: DPP IV N-terminal domain-containing protein [Nannocystales bacterium]